MYLIDERPESSKQVSQKVLRLAHFEKGEVDVEEPPHDGIVTVIEEQRLLEPPAVQAQHIQSNQPYFGGHVCLQQGTVEAVAIRLHAIFYVDQCRIRKLY